MNKLSDAESLAAFDEIPPTTLAEQFGAYVAIKLTTGESAAIRVLGSVNVGGREMAIHHDIDPKYMSVDTLRDKLKVGEHWVLYQLGLQIKQLSRPGLELVQRLGKA